MAALVARHGGGDELDVTRGLDRLGAVRREGALARPPVISRETVVVPMVFPVLGGADFADTFLACRDGCTRQHLGQDLFAAKLQPVLATFDGTITYRRTGRRSAGNYLSLRSRDGWSVNYLHLNNDRPGTDDGRGTPAHTFAPGAVVGATVLAGQLLGWVGDSGNAEGTSPHLHFELRRGDAWAGAVYNAKASLDRATRLTEAVPAGPRRPAAPTTTTSSTTTTTTATTTTVPPAQPEDFEFIWSDPDMPWPWP